jgi:hypothetical protein
MQSWRGAKSKNSTGKTLPFAFKKQNSPVSKAGQKKSIHSDNGVSWSFSR